MIGADLNGITALEYIKEIPIRDFLDEQIENGLVVDYAFVGAPAQYFMRDVRNDVPKYTQFISTPSQQVTGDDYEMMLY